MVFADSQRWHSGLNWLQTWTISVQEESSSDFRPVQSTLTTVEVGKTAMADQKNTASQRLKQVEGFLPTQGTAGKVPWDPNSTQFPIRKELPPIAGAPPGAAWFWGKDDNIGRLNLLTPSRVAAATKEIQIGEMVPVNLPLNVPSQPAFGREPFKHKIQTKLKNLAYDDLYTLNTQSGTQWDGFRHFVHLSYGYFYNFTKGSDIVAPTANDKCSIHHWAEHGIAGRGVLLDYRSYAKKKGIQYDPSDCYKISWDELYSCGKDQGIDIRPSAQGGDIKIGDMLFIKSGWRETYDSKSEEENAKAALRHRSGKDNKDGLRYAGVAQEEKMINWLHDCYFATVAGDAPSFEAWPSHEAYHLHEYILSLWSMPLGEMLDLEKLAQVCREKNRWFFFFSSAPANCPG